LLCAIATQNKTPIILMAALINRYLYINKKSAAPTAAALCPIIEKREQQQQQVFSFYCLMLLCDATAAASTIFKRGYIPADTTPRLNFILK